MYQRQVMPNLGMLGGMMPRIATQPSGITLPQMPMSQAPQQQQPGLLSGINPMMLAGLMSRGKGDGMQSLFSGLAGGAGPMSLAGLEGLSPDLIAQLAGGRFGGLS